MEDLSTVLWIVVIVAAMVFNGVSQARKQAKKQAPKADRHAGNEAWPSWDTASAPERRTPATAEVPERKPGMQPVTAMAATTIAPSPGFDTDDGGTVAPGQPGLRTGHNAPRKVHAAQGADPHAGQPCPQDDVLAEITDDFDLRRAVIYSEILKPKFDE